MLLLPGNRSIKPTSTDPASRNYPKMHDLLPDEEVSVFLKENMMLELF